MGPVTSPDAIAAAVNIATRFANAYMQERYVKPDVSEGQLAQWRGEGKQYLLDYLDENYDNYTYGNINLNYTSFKVVFTLKNGGIIARDYSNTSIPVQFLLDDLSIIYGEENFRAAQMQDLMLADDFYVPETLNLFELYYDQPPFEKLNAEDRIRLLAVLRADMLELTIDQQKQNMPLGALRLRIYGRPVGYPLKNDLWQNSERPYRSVEWPIYASFSRTLAFFAEKGYEPKLWQPQLQDVISVSVVDYRSNYDEKYGYQPMPPAVYESSGAYSIKMDAVFDPQFERNEITDPAVIAEIMFATYPEQATRFNCFIDIDRRKNVEVSYKGPGGQTYVLQRVFPY
jgi:hypothetical protein